MEETNETDPRIPQATRINLSEQLAFGFLNSLVRNDCRCNSVGPPKSFSFSYSYTAVEL